MANTESAYYTNFFKVTDEEAYNNLISKLSGEYLYFSEKKEENLHSFSGYDSLSYIKTEDDILDVYDFIDELRAILPDNECIVYIESGHDKLRDVYGYAIIATNKEIREESLSDFAQRSIEQMLGKDYNLMM